MTLNNYVSMLNQAPVSSTKLLFHRSKKNDFENLVLGVHRCLVLESIHVRSVKII